MINRFTLHDAASAPAASSELLDGVQKSWGSFQTCTACWP